MKNPARDDMAPDMGRLILALPAEGIVLLSWTVSEYDGLSFVKTDDRGDREDATVSLYFPRENRSPVLELIKALKSEGRPIKILREEHPEESSLKANSPEEP